MSNNTPCSPKHTCCGPEIGPALREVLRRTLSGSEGFESWPDKEKARCCDALIKILMDRLNIMDWAEANASNSWDIEELFSDDLETKLLQYFSKYGCAQHGDCKQTVMVDGQCHKDWAVNYMSFGYMTRICRYRYPLDLLRTTTIFGTEIPVKKSRRYQYRAEQFSLQKLIDLVGGYKTLKAIASKSQGYKLADVNEALSWAQFGYFNHGYYIQRGPWHSSRNPKRLVAVAPRATHPQCQKCPLAKNHPKLLNLGIGEGGLDFSLRWAGQVIMNP